MFNAGDTVADLSGWLISDASGSIILISPSAPLLLGPAEYLIIERTDDTAVSDIPAGYFGSFGGGGLSNSICEHLKLVRLDGSESDEAAPCNEEGGWSAGTAGPDYATAERISTSGSGTDSSNWLSNTGGLTTGLDAASNPVRGTPKYRNSASPTL